MEIRRFRPEDAKALADLSAYCARGEGDFVLNPYWESEDELLAEFGRFEIDPGDHLVVADGGGGEVLGLAGFLRRPGAREAGMCCPIVARGERGKGLGGRLLRAARDLGRDRLGLRFVTAGIGTRNRAGYALLTSHGFRPVRQHFLMRCDEKPEAPVPEVDGLMLDAAKDDDADAILEIYAACGFEHRSLETMRRALADGRHCHSVARVSGRVAAFAEVETHWPKRCWVAFVGVAPEMRDRGLGTAIASWALAQRFDEGARSGLLMLSPANRTALRAYEKVGFRRHRMVDVLEQSF